MSLQIPAYLAQRTASLGDDLTSGLGGQRPPSLSIKAQNFTLIDAAGNEKPAGLFDQTTRQFYIDVVVVDGNRAVSKTYYADAYDPNATEFKPPTCYSDNGVGPSSQAQSPQSPSCAACPHNVWGSSVNAQTGKQSKSCQDAKKVAVIVPGQAQLDMAFLLRIPPNTLNKFWAPYLRTLAGMSVGNRPVDASDVVTRITFDATTQGTLNFQAVRFIEEGEFKAVMDLQAGTKTAQLVGKTDTVYQGALPAPQAAPAISAPPIQPVQQPQFQPQQPQVVQTQQPFLQPGVPGASPFGQAAPPQQPMFMQPQQTNVTPLVPPGAIPAQTVQRQRVRRTQAEMQAARQQAPQPAAAPQPEIIPPQAQQMQPPMFGQPQPQPPAPTVSHGMVQNAPPPPSDMAAALANALNLPTGG